MTVEGASLPIRPGAALALAAGACALIGADAPTGGEPGVRTFVLSNIYTASSGEAGTCTAVADGSLERYFKLLSPEERAKYADPKDPSQIEQAKRGAIEGAMNRALGFRRVSIKGGGPGGPSGSAKLPPGLDPDKVTPEQALEIGSLNGFPRDRGRLAFSNLTVAYSACTNPEDFPQLAENFETYDGAVAPGIDLDGKVGKEDFSGLDGTKGVDNQLWRAVGCVKPFREYGERKIAQKIMISARAPTLIELRGVDNDLNDPEVTVNIYAGADAVTRDGRGEPLARASFTLDPDTSFRASTRGRIVDGELIAEPVDVKLNYKEQIIDAPRVIRDARIRAKLAPDGKIEGSFYGYYTLDSYWRSIEQMTQNGANLTGVSCPGVRRALDQLADGYRDPRTGRFTAISSAFNFIGVRAFIVIRRGA